MVTVLGSATAAFGGSRVKEEEEGRGVVMENTGMDDGRETPRVLLTKREEYMQ